MIMQKKKKEVRKQTSKIKNYIDDYKVKITHNCKKRLFTLLYNFSFSTKEAFMNYYNKAIEEIQKGVEK